MTNVYSQLKRRQSAIVAAMFDGMVRVPGYAGWEKEHRCALVDLLHQAMTRVMSAAAADEPVAEADLEFFREVGRRRGREFFPLNDLRAGFRLSHMAGTRELLGAAESRNHAELAEFTSSVACERSRTLEAAQTATRLAATLYRAVGRRLVSTYAVAATVNAIPEAYQEAVQALAVAAVMPDSRVEPYRVEELLVELAVAHQPKLRDRLGQLPAPLSAGAELRPTLEALYAHQLDRGATARSPHIHRRTLTYRLQRVRELTGIDPTKPHGIQLLRVALTASRMP
ncbi:MAG: PucR family transcriptional regulator [Stackebrandtia sp.]